MNNIILKDLQIIRTIANGIQLIYKFKNKYGASVVKHQFSYGNENGLWELAVLDNNKITYKTNITDDVIGYLSDKQVNKILIKIKNLKRGDLKNE